MKTRLALASVLVLLAAAGGLRAADENTKEVTLKGSLTCAHCDLKIGTKCQNALVVKDGDTKTVYLLADNDVSKAEHPNVCKAPKDGVSVTGAVSEKDGQKWITPSKIEMPKKEG